MTFALIYLNIVRLSWRLDNPSKAVFHLPVSFLFSPSNQGTLVHLWTVIVKDFVLLMSSKIDKKFATWSSDSAELKEFLSADIHVRAEKDLILLLCMNNILFLLRVE